MLPTLTRVFDPAATRFTLAVTDADFASFRLDALARVVEWQTRRS